MSGPVGKQPLRLVAVLFDEDKKPVPLPGGLGGMDVSHVSTSDDYYRARDISEMDRNMAFMELNSIRNRREMIMVTDSIEEITLLLTRAVREKWLIPVLNLQLGYYPNLRAEAAGKPYFLLDKFNFVDAVLTKIWPRRKIYVDSEDFSDIVHVTFGDSQAKDYGDTEHRIR